MKMIESGEQWNGITSFMRMEMSINKRKDRKIGADTCTLRYDSMMYVEEV